MGVFASIPAFVIFLLFLAFITGKVIKKKRNPLTLRDPEFTVGTMSTVDWLNSIVQRIFSIVVTKKFLTYIVKSSAPTIAEKTPITKLEFREIEIEEVPPEITQAIIHKSVTSEFVIIKCKYDPKLNIAADSEVSVSILPSFSLGIAAKLSHLDADIALGIPEKKGDAFIQMQNSTSISFDVGASIKYVSINTEYLGPVWTSIREAVNYIIRSIKIKIPLESSLYSEADKEEEEEDKKELPRNDSTHEVIEIHPGPIKSEVNVTIDPIFTPYQL